ncbi:MAG: 2-phosphosulfolactate phosphatase [Clostridia bacterium]|nr:2-phosphosulfolactate phosphatase [Clostridia bacterium]
MVIDVLRASNTIITALNNGAKEIIPVAEIETAWELKKKNPDYLLGGERKSKKIPGFDFGNSPLEYTPEKIKNRGIIFTTSNGSKALKTSEKAKHTFVASLANAKSVSKLLNSLTTDIVILCAGTLGFPSLEDTLAAGKIIAELENLSAYEINDFGLIALSSYQNSKSDLYHTLLKSRNGRRLQELAMVQDIKYCSLIDTCTLIPEYKNNKIINPIENSVNL